MATVIYIKCKKLNLKEKGERYKAQKLYQPRAQTSRRTMDNNLKSRSKVKITSLVKSASHQGQKCKKSASLFYIKKQNLHPLFINIFIVNSLLSSTNLNFEKIIKNAN